MKNSRFYHLLLFFLSVLFLITVDVLSNKLYAQTGLEKTVITVKEELIGIRDKLHQPSTKEKLIRLLGLNEDKPVSFYFTLFFYTVVVLLLSIMVIEVLHILLKKIRRVPHYGYKTTRVLYGTMAFGIIGKFFMFVFGIIYIFSQSLTISEFTRKYIAEPKKLIDLINGDIVFLFILTAFIFFEMGRRKNR